MWYKIKNSFKGINYKLLIAILLMGFVPGIYTTVRIFYMSNMPHSEIFHIAGQISWVNLIYQFLTEAIIMPLFFFIGKPKEDKNDFINKVRTGLLLCAGFYFFMMVFMMGAAKDLLIWMKAKPTIIDEAANYLKIESIANIFSIMVEFLCISLVSLEKDKYVYIITFIKLDLFIIFDLFFLSHFSFSLNLGINGLALSNIVVNFILFIGIVVALCSSGYNLFNKSVLDFSWAKDFFKIGGISGLECMIRNFFYIFIVYQSVNMLHEEGPYWVAHCFIYGWLMVPVEALGELIRQEIARDKNHIQNNFIAYLIISLAILSLWGILVPTYQLIFKNIYGIKEFHKVYHIVTLLMGFYAIHSLQNIGDSIFYGLGKTRYLLYAGIITNLLYFGVAFVLKFSGVYQITNLTQVDTIYGIGLTIDAVVSFVLFFYWSKKEHIKFF